ncbi:hypothetical protein RhiirA1_458334 [Rhizophagus irregularis]|uniref:Uncharacterized protein n=1 Tax=Rhizophagus irregularis TaxID=588596 RepID=A0A2N0RW29_9GLOM|nr:hypothetical protein RhiirA1_458334 [Rhizophagus irregularis]CAB4495804.1 unnamed protein product [Rhizophagus irregularis]
MNNFLIPIINNKQDEETEEKTEETEKETEEIEEETEETEEETEEIEEETEEIKEETESIILEQNVESSDALSSLDDVPKKDERNENVDSEGKEETDINLTFPISIDNEDYCGITLDDAIKDKNYPLNTNWPNDIYQEFMEIVTEYQLSNSCGDRLIKLVNSINNIDKNLLPKTTKEGRRFIDDSEFPYIKFKTVPITNFQDIEYFFHYQPIINEIKTLLLQSDINKEFVFQYQNNTVKTAYGEQFETSEYPIYISLRNISHWLRNKPEVKVLVGYLPKLKAKDNNIRNSKSFRKLQRQVFQRYLRILLSPILNQNNMYFTVKNEINPFTPKISVILADMAEAGAFTATYLISPINFQKALTPENMREIIDKEQAFSVHEEFNYFWKFKNFNIYEATVSDRMHLLDLGITKYLLEFTHEYLQRKVSIETVKEMDH